MSAREILEIERDSKELIRNDLGLWCGEALASQELAPARHHRLLIKKLKAVSDGHIDRLMVFMPPGSAKSTYTSILFPPWWFAQNPRSCVIAASHTAELAEKFGRNVRNTVALHQDILGYTLNQDNRAAGRWETTNGGEYFAAGVLGAITGRRADLGIIDDPVKSADEAVRDTVRDRVWDWYQSDFYTRLKPNARIILIMTRWHEDDLGGRLLAMQEQGGDKWEVLCLPALAYPDGDPLGRKAGQALWPEWESEEQLDRKRKAVGERVWASLYQQEPRPPDNEAFFQLQSLLVDGLPVQAPIGCDAVFATIDTAVKTGKKNDGTAVIFWCLNKHKSQQAPLTILGYQIAKIEGALLESWLPTVFQMLEQYAQKHRARAGSLGSFIEDKASGTILLQQAKRRNWPAIPITSTLTAMGKVERAISVSGYVTRGMVKLSQEAYDCVVTYNGRTCNHLISQITQFRLDVADAADDALDAFTYGIALALGNQEGY